MTAPYLFAIILVQKIKPYALPVPNGEYRGPTAYPRPGQARSRRRLHLSEPCHGACEIDDGLEG